MLVLSRKKNDSIVIDLRDVDLSRIPKDQRIIRVVTVEIRGDKVRNGVEANKDIPVHREEVFNAIERERQSA